MLGRMIEEKDNSMTRTDCVINQTKQPVEYLKGSPVFAMSLGAKELFHSNFLAWFWNNYSGHAMAAFSGWMGGIPKQAAFKAAEREKNNFDLTISFSGDHKLVIENKVKAVPSKAQLEEYSRKLSNEKHPEKIECLMLSLTPPRFCGTGKSITIDGGGNRNFTWGCMSYCQLADALQEASNSITGYDGCILKDYIASIRALSELVNNSLVEQGQSFFCESGDFSDLRITDVIRKLRYGQLVEAVSAKLPTSKTDLSGKDFLKGSHGDVFLHSFMTRSLGGFDLKYIVSPEQGPFVVGIQIQGSDLRLFVETIGGKVNLGNVAEELLNKKAWFDFSQVCGSGNIRPDSQKKGNFLKFGGTFLYRAKALPKNMNLEELSDLVVKFATQIEAKKQDIQETINNFC